MRSRSTSVVIEFDVTPPSPTRYDCAQSSPATRGLWVVTVTGLHHTCFREAETSVHEETCTAVEIQVKWTLYLQYFFCNHVLLFYRFWDITIYWSKFCVYCCFHSPQSCLKPSQGGSSAISYQNKAKVPGLPDGENRMILLSLVLTHYQNVTDGQTDGQTRRIIAQVSCCEITYLQRCRNI